MNNKEMTIKISIEDWKNAFRELGYEIIDQDDMVKLAKKGIKPMELARHAIVSRELGIADKDILPPNKYNLNTGGMYAISQIFARRHKDLQVNPDDPEKTLNVRELVLQVGEDDNGGEAVDSQSEKGLHRAVKYLHGVTIGHIKSRLNIIAYHLGADGVKNNMQLLRDELDQLELELLSVLK